MPSNDEVASTARDSLSRLVGSYAKWVILALVVVYLLTGFHSVAQNEIGILFRFGKVIDNQVAPGMHYALPRPVDRIEKVAVKEMKLMVIDDFAREYADASPADIFKKLTKLPPYCITADNNVVNIAFVIKYTVTDPVAYLLTIKDGERLLRNIAAQTLIHALTCLSVDEALTFGKERLASDVKLKLQEHLNDIDSGVSVSFIELRDVSPPESVQSYFDDVINAKVERSRMLNDAESYSNRRISGARSDAARVTQEAHAYETERVCHAEGDAARFAARLEEYRKGKDVNRARLYLEFVQTVFPALKQIIVIDRTGSKPPLKVKVLAE